MSTTRIFRSFKDLRWVAERCDHAFGVGRFCGLEHLEQGEKVLEVREAPAAHLLMDAFRHLETATLDAELLREKHAVCARTGRYAPAHKGSRLMEAKLERRTRCGCAVDADSPRGACNTGMSVWHRRPTYRIN